jgi:hypothetical protein
MLASAGFGCHFAFTQGARHGLALAGFAVAMAAGLELAKPFAIEAAFACFRRWAIARGLALLLLGVVAIAYSLTAELSLMATTRGDAAAARAKASVTTEDDRAELARLNAERAAMRFIPADADAVAAARKAAETAERSRKAECGDGDPRQRGKHCRAREEDEKAATDKLTATVANKAASDLAAKLDADAETVRGRLASGAPVGSADPGASAISNYLALFGLYIPAALLAEWLVLVGVIALELGSALAVVLVRAMGTEAAGAVEQAVATTWTADARPAWTPDARPAWTPEEPPKAQPAAPRSGARTVQGSAKRGRGQRLGPLASVSKADAGQRIVDALAGAGGRLEDGTVRKLARLIGGRKSTVHSALAALVASGAVAKVGAELVLRG